MFFPQLHVFIMGFDWFIGLPEIFVIGQNDYFGFGGKKYHDGKWRRIQAMRHEVK